MKIYSLAFILICCTYIADKTGKVGSKNDDATGKPAGKTILTRFNCPDGYQRLVYDSGSFGWYLENLLLKEVGEPVKYYDGRTKDKGDVYCAVVAMEISDKDLQQCADAVMRLRGEY